MTSSTLRSKKHPGIALLLFLAFLGAWSLGSVYTLKLNPETRLLKHQYERQTSWAAENLPAHQPKFILLGGSSSAFSISSSQALSNNIALLNVAMQAGQGRKVLTRLGLLHARAGDTVIMALEPDLLADTGRIPLTGAQLSVVLGAPQLCDESEDPSPHLRSSLGPYLLALRPGGYHFFTMLGKLAMGRPLYRYGKDGVQHDGRMETGIRLSPEQVKELGAPALVRISPEAGIWLQNVKAYCETHDLKVFYSLPWALTKPEHARKARYYNAQLLKEIRDYIPVLKDATLGVHTNSAHFSDTVFHMNTEGAAIRTAALVTALQSGECWTSEELSAIEP